MEMGEPPKPMARKRRPLSWAVLRRSLRRAQ